jgi:hypothetical protein
MVMNIYSENCLERSQKLALRRVLLKIVMRKMMLGKSVVLRRMVPLRMVLQTRAVEEAVTLRIPSRPSGTAAS